MSSQFSYTELYSCHDINMKFLAVVTPPSIYHISRGGGDCATKVGALWARFVDMGAPVKTQAENGLSNLFNFRGQTIDVSDQAFFILKD